MKRDIDPARADYPDVMAVRAVAKGEATPDQQKRALDWIINEACGRYNWSFTAGQRETDVNLGRQRVGISITDIVNMPAKAVDKLRTDHERRNSND